MAALRRHLRFGEVYDCRGLRGLRNRLQLHRRWIRDDGAWGYDLVCGEFSFDGGDCDGDGTSDGDGGPPTGDGGGTPSGGVGSCGDDMVYDCDMECVIQHHLRLVGDGICTMAMNTNLDCAEFDFDGGDCDSGGGSGSTDGGLW